MAAPAFRRDLYRGTADDYDRFRVPYPPALVDDLVMRCGADGRGRLLDLACGTGQVAFALQAHFAEIWAVDQEPDMVRVVEAKAAKAGIGTVRAVVAAAERFAPEEPFDLVAIGNAFHRLPRRDVAAAAARWLRPGGHLALLWSPMPWGGEAAWQRAMAQAVRRWMTRVRAQQRIPPGYAQHRQDEPDADVLRDAGFESVCARSFPVAHEWTVEALTGCALSTSVLSRQVLGDLVPRFEEDLREALRPHLADDLLHETIHFEYHLARR